MNNISKVKNCFGCGACSLKCPKQAIQMLYNKEGQAVPYIDENLCVNCTKCVHVCPAYNENCIDKQYEKKAYIAVNQDEDSLKKSASGGVAAALAYRWLTEGGIVCGASGVSPRFVNDRFHVEHILIYAVEEIAKIQGSKYVQSDLTGVLSKIEVELKAGKKVLFFGTSCQVAAVKAYLGLEYENFSTVDLICHGVIGNKMFDKYLKSVEDKEGNKLIDVSFRTKEQGIPYTFTFTFIDSNHNTYVKYLDKNKSSYYRMFLGCIGYRQSCYTCKFANINKPADITLGDYYEAVEDYPELFESKQLDMKKGISSVIIHTEKGMNMLLECNLITYSADVQRVIKSHTQLQHPSVAKKGGCFIIGLYKLFGWNGVNLFYAIFDKLALGMRKIKSMLKR